MLSITCHKPSIMYAVNTLSILCLLQCEVLFSISMGVAADSWQAWTDRYLTENDDNEKKHLKAKMLELIDIYYDALDAPKIGKTLLFLLCFFDNMFWNSTEIVSLPNIVLPFLPLLKQVRVPNQLKPGRYPHYMEKGNNYKSYSVLGKICDAVEKYKIGITSRYGEFYLLSYLDYIT